MPHVFVETNWLFAFAAPAHHQVPAAARLLDRAKSGDFHLHLPSLCIGEARRAISLKCQPRSEADALRRYLAHATEGGSVTHNDAAIVRTTLSKYETRIKAELGNLDDRLQGLGALPCLTIFSLDDAMLARATALTFVGITRDPFDQAILAGVLVGAERLWTGGERGLSFCETDSDLQPWGRNGETKTELRAAYDSAHVWVFGDFTLTQPTRPPDFA